MTPRPGGEADKFGARYEGAWTVWRLLDLLIGNGFSLTVEVAAELDDGAEFLYVRAADGVVEAHQVKRQKGNANGWTVKSLHDLGIWANAKQHIARGREFHFASTIPAPKLQALADRARRSANLDGFVKKDWLTKGLEPQFDELAKADIYGSPANAWEMLRGIYFHCVDEDSVVNHNAGMSAALLEGAVGRLAAIGLGDLVVQNLGVELTTGTVEPQLSTYGLRRASSQRGADLRQSIETLTRNWRDSVRRELLSPAIHRNEAGEIAKTTRDATTPIVFVAGTAGAGKSATLAQAVDQVLDDGVPALVFRLDRLGDFGTTIELGERLGLPLSPVPALAAAANGQPCLLIIDQLDAVSLASGRIPNSFNAVEDLVREASAFPNMHVVLACRQFDIDNDYRIRTLVAQLSAKTITVAALSVEAVDKSVEEMGLDPSSLTIQQRELLRLPLHLVLLASVADLPDALSFQTMTNLFDAYWRRKQQMIEQRKPGTRFMDVIAIVTTAISDRQQLSVSDSVLDAKDLGRDGDAFISEHVLVRDGNRIAFFHEAFFDYAFARRWATQGESMVAFLTANEQELFRRAQVSQILQHLRERDSDRYLAELQDVLTSPGIRFHIKEVILALLSSLDDPTAAESRLVAKVAASDPDMASHMWQRLRSGPWFARLDADGLLQRWLSSESADEQQRAVGMLSGAVRTNPDRVAAVLALHRENSEYSDWLFWAVRFAHVHESRPLFELVLEAVRAGAASGREHLLWMSISTLADHEPRWAIELISAYFIEWSGGTALAPSGKVGRLEQSDYGLAELVQKAAHGAPLQFVNTLLPYMTEVMQLTAHDTSPPGFPSDPHFSYYYEEMAETSDADDALHVAMRAAIEQVVRADPDGAKAILEGLASSQLSSAQSLLYLGLIAGAEHYADWSADLLLESVDRLFCGTMSNSVWVARQLIAVVAQHISDARHQALEVAVRDLRFSWEGRHGGRYAFDLLSGLQADRLTELGKRRLGEYQRKFNADRPAELEGVSSGWVGPPIPSDAIVHMTDENWRQAITKHDSDRTDWSSFKGGARELANVLQQQTKAAPLRFARLALQLTTDTHAAYGDGILLGLGEAAAVAPEDEANVFEAVRHIASLGQPSNDRWLGYALRPYLKSAPLDLVELIRDRAASASDPVADRIDDSGDRGPGDRLRSAGMNSARGSLVEELGNLLVYDVDGTRTAAVTPVLDQLATDPVLSVRAQAAHTLAAVLRFDRPAAVAAFSKLVEVDDDDLLAGHFVRRLMTYIGNGGDAGAVLPVLKRMVNSESDAVRQCGGELALVAALNWAAPQSLDRIMASTDSPSRRGVALAAAAWLSSSPDAALAATTLTELFDDPNSEVRKAAAGVAPNLRNHALAPYEPLLMSLINSAAFEAALPQLFLTLEHAPDEVGPLALRSAQRFIEVHGAAAGDMRTAAARDSRYVCDLVIRGLAQSHDPTERAALLDVVDELMKVGAYGVGEAVDSASR
ncbi:MAG: hypothetical protein QOD07_3205 [Frankiaceae bacterium]|jgi:hypothetical protein|nr:hypothetical protein [Frankiaceae bacterium]